MIIAFNKPYGVLSQFTKEHDELTLKDFNFPSNTYPIGRLDKDSEGLLLLSDEKRIVDALLNPKHKHKRTYLVQVENLITEEAIKKLEEGVELNDFTTAPAKVTLLPTLSNIPERETPIRSRKNIPTSWIELEITEGKNRQVRRMTANVGNPTLRLIRIQIGAFKLSLPIGKWRMLSKSDVDLLMR